MKKLVLAGCFGLSLACQSTSNPAPETGAATVSAPRGDGASLAALPERGPSAGGWVFENPDPIGLPALALWGDALTDFYAVGPSGMLLHYHKSGLRSLEAGTRATLSSVWGAGGALFVVGEQGTILRGENGSLAKQESGTKLRLLGVWARAANEAYAVGEQGTILRYDGARWSPMESGTTQTLRAVAGRGGEVFAAGEQGVLLRYDGARWSPVESGSTAPILALYADETQVVAAGLSGALLRSRDGKTFAAAPAEARGPLFVIWSEDGTLYAAGPKTIVRCPGETCTAAEIAGDPLLAALARGEGAAFASASGRLYIREGEKVTELITGTREQFNDLTTQGKAPLAASSEGLYERRNHAWTLLPETRGAFIESVSGNDTGDLAVGPAGLALRRGADAKWYKEDTGTEAWLTDVYVPAHSDAYVVGHGGLFLHRKESGEWEKLPLATSYSLFSLSGRGPADVYMVGESGTVYRYDGKSFLAESAPTSEDLKSVSAGKAGIFAVGKKGTILRRKDDGAWVVEESSSREDLYSVAQNAQGEVFASGTRGTILRRDSSGTWSPSPTETLQPLLGVTLSPAGNYAVGAGGVILRKAK
jgi:hypothetical protein